MKMLSLLIVFCLPQFISSSNLALTFDAANSTCTAVCSTCSDTSNATLNNNTAILEELLNTTWCNNQEIKEMQHKMDSLNTSFSHIKDILHNLSSISPLPNSCKEIKNKQPNSPSGVYLLATANDGAKYAYCNMEELCGSGGGWTRLAYLKMSDATVNCPSGFNLCTSGDIRACGRAASSRGGCTSVQFPSNGISYSQVCSRVVGYQYGSIDAIQSAYGDHNHHNDINSYYVDGISITRGSPRQHVWTLMGGLYEDNRSNGQPSCPCSPAGSPYKNNLQSFIGNDYFCESGNPTSIWKDSHFYPSDPLWDGKECSREGDCCTAPGLPWFHKDLNTNTTDHLEMRLCADQGNDNEDTPVSFYELYVK